MTTQVIRIDLITEKGTFKFEPRHTSTADFYQSLLLFEGSNWETLGGAEFNYNVFTKFEDGVITETLLKGVNASADLAAYMEEDAVNQEINQSEMMIQKLLADNANNPEILQSIRNAIEARADEWLVPVVYGENGAFRFNWAHYQIALGHKNNEHSIMEVIVNDLRFDSPELFGKFRLCVRNSARVQ
jgi:hypothetical protein